MKDISLNTHRKAIIKNKQTKKTKPKQHKLPTYISMNVENVHSSTVCWWKNKRCTKDDEESGSSKG